MIDKEIQNIITTIRSRNDQHWAVLTERVSDISRIAYTSKLETEDQKLIAFALHCICSEIFLRRIETISLEDGIIE